METRRVAARHELARRRGAGRPDLRGLIMEKLDEVEPPESQRGGEQQNRRGREMRPARINGPREDG